MADSKHSAIRMQQRAISRDKVDFILEHGVHVPVAGGADLCMVTRQQIHDWVGEYKRTIRRLESLKDTAVLLSGEGNVITVEHLTHRHKVAS